MEDEGHDGWEGNILELRQNGVSQSFGEAFTSGDWYNSEFTLETGSQVDIAVKVLTYYSE